MILLVLALTGPATAAAAVIETSALVSYGKADLGNDVTTRQNRYTFSVAYRFTKVSALEVSYSQSRTKISTPLSLDSILFPTIQETITFDDQVYSLSWIQNLVSSKWIIQPYLKLGAGKLVRKKKAEYSTLLDSQEEIQKSETGVAGIGLRLFLTKRMALKGEAITYLPEFRVSKWKESQQFSGGLSWLF